jgi:thiazole synthase ThiGH ThiG subunit
MTRKTLYADDVKAAILSKCDEIMKRVLTDDALPIVITQAMRREVHTMKHCVEIIDSLPAAEPDAGGRVAREYAELVRLCRHLLNQEWEQLNLDPIGEFITELDANGFISYLAASRPSVKE